MPDHHRGSHRAARNWGAYPHNGAERREVSRDEAIDLVEADGDRYNHVVGSMLLTIAEVGDILRRREVPAMAFWQRVAGGDMTPIPYEDLDRLIALSQEDAT